MNKQKVISFLKIACSGIFGTVLTLTYQHFFQKNQTFTFIYNGKEVVVTESDFTELMNENNQLKKDLTSTQNELNSANSDLVSLTQQLEAQDTENEINQTIKDATEYWNNSEYIQSLSLLKQSKNKSEYISSLYKKYSNEYCKNILNQADNLISERQYDSALQLIEESKKIVDDYTVLEDKISTIGNSKPIKLSTLKMSTSRYLYLNETAVVEDSVGNKYSTNNLFIIRAEGDSKYGYGTFYLDNKYTSMSGIIAVSDESSNREDTQLEGWIEIYSKNGDEYMQLYSSPLLSRMTSPITFNEINISNCEWLEIRYYNSDNYYTLSQGHLSLKIILSDITLYSN